MSTIRLSFIKYFILAFSLLHFECSAAFSVTNICLDFLDEIRYSGIEDLEKDHILLNKVLNEGIVRKTENSTSITGFQDIDKDNVEKFIGLSPDIDNELHKYITLEKTAASNLLKRQKSLFKICKMVHRYLKTNSGQNDPQGEKAYQLFKTAAIKYNYIGTLRGIISYWSDKSGFTEDKIINFGRYVNDEEYGNYAELLKRLEEKNAALNSPLIYLKDKSLIAEAMDPYHVMWGPAESDQLEREVDKWMQESKKNSESDRIPFLLWLEGGEKGSSEERKSKPTDVDIYKCSLSELEQLPASVCDAFDCSFNIVVAEDKTVIFPSQPGESCSHIRLSKGRGILFSGKMYLDRNRRIIAFSNGSGHFKPNKRETERFRDMLIEAGVFDSKKVQLCNISVQFAGLSFGDCKRNTSSEPKLDGNTEDPNYAITNCDILEVPLKQFSQKAKRSTEIVEKLNGIYDMVLTENNMLRLTAAEKSFSFVGVLANNQKVKFAGRIVFDNGRIILVTNESGWIKAEEKRVKLFRNFLVNENILPANAVVYPVLNKRKTAAVDASGNYIFGISTKHNEEITFKEGNYQEISGKLM